MDFVRSSPAPRPDCALGPRDQINQITSYLDASGIYGSTAEQQHELRILVKGKLKYTDLHIRKPLLPALRSSQPRRCAGSAPPTSTASTPGTTG